MACGGIVDTLMVPVYPHYETVRLKVKVVDAEPSPDWYLFDEVQVYLCPLSKQDTELGILGKNDRTSGSKVGDLTTMKPSGKPQSSDRGNREKMSCTHLCEGHRAFIHARLHSAIRLHPPQTCK